MKQLVLTGIAQETSLQDPEDSYYLLVFNDGELRVPTNEQGVHLILGSLGEPPEAEPAEVPNGAEVFGGGTTAQETADWLAQQQNSDDDDDYDVNDGVGSV